ncbi:Glutathione S-transferase DHAR1, mitochondrial [Gracilariopsis chorda]|uniref:Glutathione S-transferase DHAR1, mitochondrial n=1 Tax=Gracilariopsis chorda TaxID=448386 RepID=A0A2V3IR01_9FLOR|nr:Glutathione S-transferase DHAR1, mitochondrial [Gracilariopsis chorda]|eukprot:PXF44523.1 Glutathione S-transferase DHAR1, mitochondrial [Gracilariopsis chorda]
MLIRTAFLTPAPLGKCANRATTSVTAKKKIPLSVTRRRSATMSSAPTPPSGKMLFAKAGPDGTTLGDCPFSQKANLALRFNGVKFDVHCINLSDKPQWFKDLTEAASTPVFQEADTVLEDSDKIVRHADAIGTAEAKLVRENEPLWNDATAAVGAVFKPFVTLMKNRDVSKEEQLRQDLDSALQKVEHILAQTGAPFLLGEHVSALDCDVAPKLQHIMVAASHYKKYNVPTSCERLPHYMQRMRQTAAWRQSACADQVIVWGWSKLFK